MVYVVDKKKNAAFKGAEGHITADLIKQHLPPPSDDHLILVCGPPGMMKAMSGDKAPVSVPTFSTPGDHALQHNAQYNC